MFDYNKMIKRAIEFFPRWTDIRKRYKTSNGGNLIGAVLDESLKIEEAIQEYIDSYFLETYEGHEDEVMAFSYMASIGKFKDLGRLTCYYDTKLLMVTNNTRLFNEDKYDEYIYYEEGRLFIKESLYEEGVPLTVIIDDDTITEYQLTKFHVWNIFDEFATFVNTRRYENETNKQLLDRILYITRNLPNGSEAGLKHAIISELMHFDPEVKMDDIKIERATPENLLKPYEDFESLLEKMMYINRDVFKCKRWDLDYWVYEFESISYIPHKWNEAISHWQNGIGHGDDLQVILADSAITKNKDGVEITNAKLSLYNKSLTAFEKYIHNKNIDCDVDFQLVKYNNILNKANIKYKLKASELVDITYEDIKLNLYESEKADEVRRVEDLYSFGAGYEVIDNSSIPADDINWYKIQFKQRDDKEFKITTATVRYEDVITGAMKKSKNLIVQQPGFIYNAEKELVSVMNQKIIKRAEDFNNNTGLVTIDDGITIENGQVSAQGAFPLNNYAGMKMDISYSCDKVDVPKALIQAKGCYWSDDKYVIRGDYSIEDKLTEINIEATSFEFKVLNTKMTGRTTVTVFDNGQKQDPVYLEPESTFSIEEKTYSRPIKIVIETLSFNDVILSDFKYSSYSINISTDYGSLTKAADGRYHLPSVKNNNLNISLYAATGTRPIIHNITIGDSVDKVIYTTGLIDHESLCERKFVIKTTADMNLLRIKPFQLEHVVELYPDLIQKSYEYANSLFADNIREFLNKHSNKINQNPNATLSETVKMIVYDITLTILSQIVNGYLKTDTFEPHIGKVFTKEYVANTLPGAYISYVEKYISEAEDIEIPVSNLQGTYKLSTIFPELTGTITRTAKIEWVSLAQYMANKIAEMLEEGSMEDLGLFTPMTAYKGQANYKGSANSYNAPYIRLDLSEYETVTSIIPDGGFYKEYSIDGTPDYVITLENGATVSTVRIIGTRNKTIREVTLQDMVTYYIPDFNDTYDKILCSRLLDALIVSRKNPGGTPFNSIIKLDSEMLTGITATKYEMKLPSYIGSRYGNHTQGSNDNPVSYQSFDYISFYPAGGIIYEAINEYDSYMEDNRDIKIVNNFVPALDINKLLVFTVENMNESEKDKYIIRFHDASTIDSSIYDLDTWCVGNNPIAIQNNIDLANDISYNVNTYNINSKELLSSMIEIKNTYHINNSTILDTSQFMVIPPNNMTIKYEEYNGTQDKAHLLKTEEIIVGSDKFNKLVYSNIDSIYHLSKEKPASRYIIDNANAKHILLKDQGIIIWDNSVVPGTRLYVVYSIKKPIGFLIDLDDLYKAVNYDVEAYKQLDSVFLYNIEDDTYKRVRDIEGIVDIENIDLIHIECDNPTFEGVLVDDKIYFNKFVDKNYVLIKSGYYYINGKEFFLYSSDEDEDIVNNKYYDSENINISGGEILTYKPTNNFVTNTEMRLRGKAGIYNFDCDQEYNYGISTLNTLTACESFNEWSYFAMSPRLVTGTNGLAMEFGPTLPCSYAYLEITDALVDEEINYISLLASEELTIHLAEEERYLGINFNRTLNVALTEEIPYEGSIIRILPMIKDPNVRYYLVVQNAGTLDDIIITTNKYDALNGHSKNIDLLGLDLLETKVKGSECRLAINNNKDYTAHEAAMMSNGYFKPTSKLDWYITEVASFTKEREFFTCVLNNLNVTKTYINTNNTGGDLLTPPIYLNNQSTIKRLILKINDVELDQMSGFNIIAYTSDTYDGYYSPIGNFKNNREFILGESLLQYVKFKIEIPAHKILDSIHVFAEYTSSEENPLRLLLNESGYIESKIYDLQDTLDYRLKDLGIEDISNINDIELYIRASRDIEKIEIWHDWQRVYLKDDLTLRDYLKFYDVRFMQIKILLKTRQSYIKFNHLDIEVI